tara:strand:- start:527 stop:670 length:144 start_codon:yes stop_codon:yes gene_type:complete
MAKSYRKQMTPGMKMCKDYYEGKSKKEYVEEKAPAIPPAYTMPKLNK